MGWLSYNYPCFATTVTITPLLSPIPGPMPYSYKFAKLDMSYVRFHTEATTSQVRSPPPPNSPSLPSPSDGIRNLPSHQRVITAWPHTGIEHTFHTLSGQPLRGTANTTPCSQSSRITAAFLQIIRQKPSPMKTVTKIMTTTREEMAEDNWREGGGLPG